MDLVRKLQVSNVIEKRAYRVFPTISPDPLHKLNREEMETWIKRKAGEFIRSKLVTCDQGDTEIEPYTIGLNFPDFEHAIELQAEGALYSLCSN